MSDKVIKVSAKAAEDAAKGLKNTDAQVELGRQVDRMYGSYQKFGPGLRNAISTYTPFVSWTINAVNFLYRVLPADHPVLTSLVASANRGDGGLPQEARPVPGLLRADEEPAAAVAAGVDSRQGRLAPSGLALHAVRAARQRRRNPNRRAREPAVAAAGGDHQEPVRAGLDGQEGSLRARRVRRP
jgi:hypothetical protein